MKIASLDLRAFGPFSGVVLDLSSGDQGLHLVYGPNEAGKSSALRALRHLLYGIPNNTSDDFIHKGKKLRIGAVLAGRDGARLEVLRRKGLKNTLLEADDKTPMDEARLRTLLGGCDEGQFATMFGINHGVLVAGGKDIVSGKGEVGHVLFAAGAGVAGLRSIRTDLENEADLLFSPRASKPAINQALSALKDARKRIRDGQLPSTEWVRHDKALREAGERLADVEARLQHAQRENNRLTRIGNALPVIGKRKQLQQALAELGDVPRLAEKFPEIRQDTQAQIVAAEKAEQGAREALDQIDRQLGSLSVPENLLAQADEIENVYRALSVYRKAQSDLPVLAAKKEQLERDASAILAELRPDLTLEAAPQLRLAKRQQVEIQNLGNRQASLQQQLDQALAQIEDAKRRLAEAKAELATQPQPRDPGPLIEAVRQAQSQGNLSQQLVETLAEVRQLQQQADLGLKRLGLWSGPLDELESLALPVVETVDRFDREMTEAQTVVARGQDALDKAQAAVAELDRRLEELQLEGAVPTEDDLAAARQLRDLGWQLVLSQWVQGGADAKALDEFLSRFPGKKDLAAAYEQSVRAADELADRLRREANRVATRATLRASRSSQLQQVTSISEQLTAAREAQERTKQAWADCWRASGIEPLPPREMRAWLQRQQALVAQVQALRLRQASASQLTASIAEHRARLQSRLADLGQSAVDAEEDLPAALARAAAAIAEIQHAAETRRQLDRDAAQLSQSLKTASAKAEKAEAELAQWHAQWTGAIERLGLAGDACPAVVNEVVAQLNELFTRLKEAETFAERIAAIRLDGHRFQEDVQRLVLQIDPELAGLGHEQAVQEMSSRLRRATADRQKMTLLTEQAGRQQQKAREARSSVDEMQGRLRALCQEAGCDDPQELPRVERNAAEAARLRAQLDACEDDLLRIGAGATVEELMAEAEAVHTDELPAQLRGAEERIAELLEERDRLRDTIATEKAALGAMAPSATAAEAAEEEQNLLAEIQPNVEQYARLRLAAAVLREGIDRYRKKNEGPVLARASELFRRLTLDSFEGLRTDFDERGEQVLLGVRPGGETVLPPCMSDGACDQLYLALRLASLETWLARNEAIPFIVDDILISFDNDRSAATLKALAELSERTQVIFFTHHEHLVELARQHVPEDVLFIHGLG